MTETLEISIRMVRKFCRPDPPMKTQEVVLLVDAIEGGSMVPEMDGHGDCEGTIMVACIFNSTNRLAGYFLV